MSDETKNSRDERRPEYNLDDALAALASEARRCEQEQDRNAARSLDSRLGNIRARLARQFSFKREVAVK
ncbi:MAG: hypothetical protein H0X14_00045 [Acidobacteria bacterium]|nr:hypothetical protein [Acidobacteriota bacterium]